MKLYEDKVTVTIRFVLIDSYIERLKAPDSFAHICNELDRQARGDPAITFKIDGVTGWYDRQNGWTVLASAISDGPGWSDRARAIIQEAHCRLEEGVKTRAMLALLKD